MTPPAPAPTDLLETASLAAAAAAAVHLSGAGAGGIEWTAEKSSSSDFVSSVDIAAQQAAVDVIRGRHPHHRILAEEEGGDMEGSGHGVPTWVVDPLDGTTNYLHGHPFHAASVAVWDTDGPLAGAVHARALGKRWEAVRGGGATEDGRPMAVSATEDPRRFLVGTGFPFKALNDLDSYLAQLARVLRGTAGIRRAGAASMDLAYVASGILDGFWELFLEPWDVGAGILLITEAGGCVERLAGGPVDLATGTVLAANSPEGLQALRAVVLGDGTGPQ